MQFINCTVQGEACQVGFRDDDLRVCIDIGPRHKFMNRAEFDKHFGDQGLVDCELASFWIALLRDEGTHTLYFGGTVKNVVLDPDEFPGGLVSAVSPPFPDRRRAWIARCYQG